MRNAISAHVRSTIRFSNTSKLGMRSWSLQAYETCPGSKDPDTGNLVLACQGCYAKPDQGNYRFPNVRAVRESNREDWQRDDWESDMVAALAKDREFRWFDSGDCYHVRLARKILNVMRATPWCRHWFPTRMYKAHFKAEFRQIFAEMRALPNVAVRFSSDDIDGTYVPGLHDSAIAPSYDKALEMSYRSIGERDWVVACPASQNDGQCGPCRACLDKDNAVTVYVAHGRTMAKVLQKHSITVAHERTPLRKAA